VDLLHRYNALTTNSRTARTDVHSHTNYGLPSLQNNQLATRMHVIGKEHVMFEGNPLMIRRSTGRATFVPDIPKGEISVGGAGRSEVRELVRRWFLEASSKYVVPKVAECAPLVGMKPSRVDVREISKWGYCTRQGRLTFSWQLASLSHRLREYIVFHELTHLVEFNHSWKFKKRLSDVCPDFRMREKELNLIIPYRRLGPP